MYLRGPRLYEVRAGCRMTESKKYKQTLADGTVVEVEDVPIPRDKIEAGALLTEKEREEQDKDKAAEKQAAADERADAFYEGLKDL